MELISIILGVILWLALIALWVLRRRRRKVAQNTFLLTLFALIVIPAAGAIPIVKWMFLDEPLLEAARDGDVFKIDQLLGRGANINIEQAGMTPLMEAIQGGTTSAVKDLVEKVANVNTRAATGETPLSIARECHRRDIEALLQRAGATD